MQDARRLDIHLVRHCLGHLSGELNAQTNRTTWTETEQVRCCGS